MDQIFIGTSEQTLTAESASKDMEAFSLQESSLVDVVNSIRQARDLVEKLGNRDHRERVELLLDKLTSAQDEILKTEARETGVPIQLLRPALQSATDSVRATLDDTEMARPIGVCLFVLPDNQIMSSLLAPLCISILCGNAVIIKASAKSFATVYRFLEIVQESLHDAVRMIVSRRETAGPILLKHPGLDAIYYVGKMPDALASNKRWLVKSSVQNPAIVLADADIQQSARSLARLCFLGQGMTSQNVSRIFVAQKAFESFSKTFAKELDGLKWGDPTDPKTDYGPMPLTRRSRFADLASGLESETHNVFWRPEWEFMGDEWVAPRVVTDLSFCSELHQTEIGGPLVILADVKYPHEAIKWANTSPFGYKACLYTQDEERAQKLSSKLEFSQIEKNADISAEPDFADSYRLSGYGPYGRLAYINFFSKKAVFR